MNESQQLNDVYNFLSQVKTRFEQENIICIDLKHYKISANNEFLQTWLQINKDFELIGTQLYKSTREDKINQQKKYIHAIQTSLILKGNKITQLKRELYEDMEKLKDEHKKLTELML